MAELKTKKTNASVKDFLDSIKDENQKKDCLEIVKIMENISGDKPKMWGSSIVGFVDVHLKYASGRELEWFKIGFSPRKTSITIYGLKGSQKQKDLINKLGKYKVGVGCLYIKNLENIDLDILKKVIEESL